MQLSQKRKTYSLFFFWFFLHVGNLDSIFNIFKKNDDPHGWCIFEIMDSEKRG